MNLDIRVENMIVVREQGLIGVDMRGGLSEDLFCKYHLLLLIMESDIHPMPQLFHV